MCLCAGCYLFVYFYSLFSQGVFSEAVSISNLGIAQTGPTVEESGSLLIEYVNGSACTTSEGVQTTYTTRIHLVCSRGSLVRRCWSQGLGGSGVCCDQHCLMCVIGDGWVWVGGGVRFL